MRYLIHSAFVAMGLSACAANSEPVESGEEELQQKFERACKIPPANEVGGDRRHRWQECNVKYACMPHWGCDPVEESCTWGDLCPPCELAKTKEECFTGPCVPTYSSDTHLHQCWTDAR